MSEDNKQPEDVDKQAPGDDANTANAENSNVKVASKPKKRKVKRSVPRGDVHVFASFNNTIITVTDTTGGKLTSSSAGSCGFRGSKKGTAYAAQVASAKAIETAQNQFGLSKANVFIKGIGQGRDAAVRVLATSSVQIDAITDITGIPHGGVRPKKARRV